MRLPKEEYNKANKCLKRYNYNCNMILNIRSDIVSLKGNYLDGMPKAAYNISDTVFNTLIELEENEELQEAINEYKAVTQALELVNKDCVYIFEELYKKGKSKWEIITNLHVSEETYKRRKRELIYTVYEELKKLTLF